MSCPRTEHLLREYFADDLAPLARQEMESHLLSCEQCSAELDSLVQARDTLGGWREQQVPHWDRGRELFRREHRQPPERVSPFSFAGILQWLPAGASALMLAALLLNVSVVSSDEGVTLSFGGAAAESFIESRLLAWQQEQDQALTALAQSLEDRQDSNNVELLQAMIEQTRQAMAGNLEQVYADFEQQRLRDLENLRAGYQELVDSDYATIRSLQQIARFVSYQEPAR